MGKRKSKTEDTEVGTDNHLENSKSSHLLPFQWKKGQSGNPLGRPKGKTMKEYARQMLECQSEEERQEFLHGLPKEIIWKMAEGNPESSTDITSKGEQLIISDEQFDRIIRARAKKLSDTESGKGGSN